MAYDLPGEIPAVKRHSTADYTLSHIYLTIDGIHGHSPRHKQEQLMDLIDRLGDLAKRAETQLAALTTEEATKNALVMPFISALGYDVFNPSEVLPEFTADVGIKRGEKVDYAILHENAAIMLFECKKAGTDLDKTHISQLFRYFTVTAARIGVLTNGLEYRFFSDLDERNKMDERPFLEFDLRTLSNKLIEELKKLSKQAFDIETVLSTASDLKYTRGIKKSLVEEWQNPTDEFVRLLASRVYTGRITQTVKDQFATITKRAFHDFVNDRVNERLKSALEQSADDTPENMPATVAAEEPRDIVTTSEELDGFHIVRAIVSSVVEPKRVYIRDTKSYCGILLDDNNRKPICRLRFNSDRTRYLGVFDQQRDEQRFLITELTDLYKYADQMRSACSSYDDTPTP